MRVLSILLITALVLAAAVILARMLFPLPDISDRAPVTAIPANPATRLGAKAAAEADTRPGQSGVIALRDGHDALGSRLALAAEAQASIDAQYYIWHDDVSGRLLLKVLYDAAERGVRVRLLLDDNGVPGLDDTMAALNAHPNFDIRLFNPSTVRFPKYAGYALDFFRMNRRMHNKSWIVDGAVAIIGGRNIGDEYFQVGDANFYLDMDVLAVGAIVPKVAASFDDYWNSASVFQVEDMIKGPGDLDAFLAGAAESDATEAAQALRGQLATSAQRFAGGAMRPEFTTVQLYVDDPSKGQGRASRDQLMIAQLGTLLTTVQSRLDLVSAYFVPGPRGTQDFARAATKGHRVRILTNALNTTDVLMVHAGYTKYRRELLEAGVELYELKLRAGQAPGSAEMTMPLGLSGAALHAKTFAVDDARVFIGSFNFDPRSALLNCEMGFVIDSPAMAANVAAAFDRDLALASYRPHLTPEGHMVWTEQLADGRQVIHQQEPGATWFQQAAIAVIGLLPVEWLL